VTSILGDVLDLRFDTYGDVENMPAEQRARTLKRLKSVLAAANGSDNNADLMNGSSHRSGALSTSEYIMPTLKLHSQSKALTLARADKSHDDTVTCNYGDSGPVDCKRLNLLEVFNRWKKP